MAASQTEGAAADYERLFDSLPGLYLILDTGLAIRAVNRAYARATMIDPQAVMGRHIFDVFPDNPDDPAADGVRNLRASLTRVLQTAQPDAMPVQKYDIRKPDGAFEERYWSPLNVPVLADDGSVRLIIHRVEDASDLMRLRSKSASQDEIARDQQRLIDELRLANAKLAQSSADNELLQREQIYLASIVESSGDAILGKSLDGMVTSWNKAAETLFGYQAAQIVGQPVARLIPPALMTEERELIARVVRGEIVVHYQTSRLRADGTPLHVSLTLSPIRDASGTVIGTSTIMRDITAQKAAEDEIRALQAERMFLADLVASSNDAIVSRTTDGKIRSWNGAAERMFGFTAAEMIGQGATLPPDLHAETEAVVERLRRGEPVIQYETRRPHKDGHDVQVSFTASLIRNPEGKIVGTSGILRDITEKKRAEAKSIALQNELAHVSRLSAMGQVSAAIAHELNQPLSAISNYLAAAQKMLEREPSLSPMLQKAGDAMGKAAAQSFRAASIIGSLRDFVENRETVRSLQDLPELIHEAVTLGMLGNKHSGITVDFALAPSSAPMMLYKVQIQQVLVNLVRNALEAMADTPEPRLHISSAADAAGVTVMVRDNGPGFAPEIAGQLFQPFVTTKKTGMGLGLRICQSILEAHGGTIEAKNAAPGAVFVIRLPAGEPA